ncbi:MAG: VOC family protein [Burkholderiaceae bacterium]
MSVSTVNIKQLHHFAYRCRDAEETRAFYEDVLGLELAHVIKADTVPSTGEYCPYVHIFFKMADNSYIAFFDLGDNKATVPDPDTPPWVNHLALEVTDEAQLLVMKEKLQTHGVDVTGPVDHGFVKSIYFFDPNGLRSELTCRTKPAEYMLERQREAHSELASWTGRKR